MRYYEDKHHRIFRHIYTSLCPISDACPTGVFTAECLIEITSETKSFMYGISWNGRWKFNKKQNQWYHYKNGVWGSRNGEFIELENDEQGWRKPQ